MQKQTNQTPFSGAVCGRIRAYSKTLSAVTLALLATAAMNASAADLTWNNGAVTGNWNLTDANWTGSVWNNAAPDNAIFDATTFQMGAINLTVPITAGSITVGSASQSDPFTQGSLNGGSLQADSVLVNGNNSGETFGNFNILTFNVPTVSIAGDVSVGLFSTLNISSGNFAASRIIPTPVNNEWVIVTISGSAVVTLTNGLDGGAFANQTFRLNLNAGSTLNTPFIVTSDRFPSNPSIGFLWNSGKVVATGSTNNFIQTFGGFNYDNKIQIGTGAVLDTAGYDIGVGVSMLAVGSGGLTKLGAGTLTLTGTNVAYAGNTVVGGGTLMVADGWHPSAGSQVVISNGFVLNLNFAGSKVVGGLVINGVTLPDGTYNAGNQPANISGTGSLLVTGGPRNMVWNNGAATGNWNTTDANWTGLIWANSRPDNAVFTTVGGSINLTVPITAGSFTFGSSALNCPNATFSGGSLQLTNNLTVQGNSGNGPRTTAVNMPTFNVGTVTAADVLVGRATLNINSGTWGVNRIIPSPISRDWGHVTIGGTAVVTATNGVDITVGIAPAVAVWGMNLDAGGTLYTPYITVMDRFAFGANAGNGADFFNWNGGKVVATVDTNEFFHPVSSGGTFFGAVYVSDGGAFFDTAGHNVGFTNNVLNNSVLAGSTGIGGFTKLGAGTLTITGETSWGGATTVDAGTLVLSFPELAANAGVIINSGAVLDLEFGDVNTVSRLVVGGVPKPPGTYNSANVPGRITGPGSLLIPALTAVSAARDYFDQTKVTVVFSTDVSPASAAVATNYTIDQSATVSAATVANPTTVVLTTSPLAANVGYTLTINNVKDLVGASIATNTQVPISVPAFVSETVRVPYSLGGTNTVVVLEAEDYNLQIPGTLGYTWEFTTTPVNLLPTATDTNYSGTGVMEAQPYTPNQNLGGSTAGPELEYKVFFPAPATYIVWVRGVGNAESFNSGGTQRSIQTGLDGILLQQISSFPQAAGYVWYNLGFGSTAQVPTVVTTPGYHKVNAWMRQQGFAFDKLLLTTSASYVPTGFGPAESPIVAPPVTITQIGANVVLTWAGGGVLQSSTNVVGTYTDIIGSSSPWTNAAAGVQKYYRVRQ